MLYGLARRVLFTMEPEKAHDFSLAWLQRTHRLASLFCSVPKVRPREVAGLSFPNPVGLSAGLDKNGDYIEAMAAMGFGFIEIGTVTPLAQPGNPAPRLFRLPEVSGIINRLGFNNKGVDYLVERVRASRYDGILGINIGKNKDTPNERAIDDYLCCLNKVHDIASYITVNISSPNTAGLRELQQTEQLSELIGTLLEQKRKLDKSSSRQVPLAVKIAPDLDQAQIEQIADVFNQVRPDMVLATNTTIARDGVSQLRHGDESGGLSGGPLMQSSTAVLQQLHSSLDRDIPIIGIGGILSADDARQKFEAGADLVQVYTGFIYKGPGLIREILESIAKNESRQSADS